MSESSSQGGSPASGTFAPLACSLIGADLHKRGEAIGELFQQATQVRELPDGYGFTFPGGDDWVHAILDFIIEERACCPFFTFEVVSASPHESLLLAIRGNEGVKAMIVPFAEKAAPRDLAAN